MNFSERKNHLGDFEYYFSQIDSFDGYTLKEQVEEHVRRQDQRGSERTRKDATRLTFSVAK